MKSGSQAKLPYSVGIFKLWTHEEQELPFLQMFMSFAYKNLAFFMRKTAVISFFLQIWSCMRSMASNTFQKYGIINPWNYLWSSFLFQSVLLFIRTVMNITFIEKYTTDDYYCQSRKQVWRMLYFCKACETMNRKGTNPRSKMFLLPQPLVRLRDFYRFITALL